MRPIRTLISYTMVLALIACIVPGATPLYAANSASENRKKAQEARDEAAAASGDLESLAAEAQDAHQKVVDLKPQVDAAVAEADRLRAEEASLTTQVEEATAAFEDSRTKLAGRIESMYRQDTNFMINFILSSETVTDFIERTTYAEMVTDANNKAAQEFSSSKKKLSKAKDDLEVVLAKAEETEAQVVSLNNQLTAAAGAAQAKLDAKNALVAQLESDAASYDKLAAQLDAASKASWSSISGSASTGTGTGQLSWPVPSSHRITSGYGDTAGRSAVHQAIDIGADPAGTYGATVVAAGSGTVIRVVTGYGGGYGNNVYIDHGNGLMTHYSHLQSVSVSAGQSVSVGQKIGEMGSTGASSGPHLDFEVYVNGSRVNPMNYL